MQLGATANAPAVFYGFETCQPPPLMSLPLDLLMASWDKCSIIVANTEGKWYMQCPCDPGTMKAMGLLLSHRACLLVRRPVCATSRTDALSASLLNVGVNCLSGS